MKFKGFKQFLKEQTITKPSDAMNILGIVGSYSEDDLKLAYRRASSKNHPDKGGSDSEMAKVNQSYELLKKTVSSNSAREDIKARMNSTAELLRQIAPVIRDSLASSLNIDLYTKYFQDLFDEDFKGVIKVRAPTNDDLSNMRGSSSPSFSRIYVEWSNKDSSKVFDLGITVSLSSVMHNKGLSSSDIKYPMGVSTNAYMNSRKVKITERDYTHTSKNAVFTKPENIFPKAKLIKKQTKFKKSDMITAIVKELKAETFNDRYLIPINDKGDYLSVSRMVFNRQAAWSVSGVFKRDRFRIIPSDVKVGFYGFPETEDTLELFRGMSKISDSKLDSYLKTANDKARE